MLPTSLVATALVPLFPLALEIDYGGIAKGAPANGKHLRLRTVITVATGKGIDSDLTAGRLSADPERLRDSFESSLERMGKWSFFRRGTSLVVLSYDGSPVTKVEITSNGQKPTARWIPRPR